MKRSWAGEVCDVSLLVASAVTLEGFREILGIWEGARRRTTLVGRRFYDTWSIAASRACNSSFPMPAAADGERGGCLPEARWQRCICISTETFSHVPAGSRGQPHAQGHPCPGEPGRG